MNRYTAVLAMVAALCQPVLAADAVQDSIDWLLSLKLTGTPPDDAPFVQVPTSATGTADGSMKVDYESGYLLSDDGTKYTIRIAGRGRQTIERGGWRQYGVEPQDEVRKLTGAELVKRWCEVIEPYARSHNARPPVGDIVAFAAGLQRRGDGDAAGTLLRRAKALFPQTWPKDEEFFELAKAQIVESLRSSIIGDFSDPTGTWKELGARLSEITQHFPGTKAAEEAELMLGPMRKAIEQEELIAKSGFNDEAIAKLPVKERVAALIQRLPDQTGWQMSIPGSVDIFGRDMGSSRMFSMPMEPGFPAQHATTPAGKLYELGWDAVPQLLEALDDRRPTRAASMGVTNGYRSCILDVGDCACQILERLAGERQRFGQSGGFASLPDKHAEMREHAEDWWNSVKDTGEVETLDQEVSVGGVRETAHVRVRRLAEIDPERAAAAIERGLAHEDQGNWDILMGVLAATNHQATRAMMNRLVTKGNSLGVRVRAARNVTQGECSMDGNLIPAYPENDQRAAREAMFTEWKSACDHLETIRSYGAWDIATLMGRWTARDLSLLPRVRGTFLRYPRQIRGGVVSVLSYELKRPTADASAKECAALEDFLGEQLEDVTYCGQTFYVEETKTPGRSARVADLAADALHQLWPERYPLGWNARLAEMEKARLASLQEWRRTRDPSAVEMAARPAVKHSPESVVAKITMGKGSQRLPALLQSQVDAWLGEPLNADALVQFLADFAAENADDKLSIGLTATRAAGHQGFAIELKVHTEQPPARKKNHGIQVSFGGKKVVDKSDTADRQMAQNIWGLCYWDLRQICENALVEPADSAIFIQTVRLGQPSGKR